MSWCSIAEELYIEVQHSDVSTKWEMSTMDVVLKTQDPWQFETLLVECFWFDIMIVSEQSKQQLRANLYIWELSKRSLKGVSFA